MNLGTISLIYNSVKQIYRDSVPLTENITVGPRPKRMESVSTYLSCTE